MAILWMSEDWADAMGVGSNLIGDGMEAKVSGLEHIYLCQLLCLGQPVSGSRLSIFDYLKRAVVKSVS